MQNQTIWTSHRVISDWFNQLEDAESFFKDNGFSRQSLVTSQIILTSENMIIALQPVESLEIQKTNIELNVQKALKLGRAMITLEMFIDDSEVEHAATTLALNLPIDLELRDFFNYIKSKIVELENAHKEFVAAYQFIKE